MSIDLSSCTETELWHHVAGHIVPRVERHGAHLLKILTPTDCVKDRLASYIHFRARECLEQAVLVARAQTADSEAVEAWCRGEGPRGPEACSEGRRLTEESSGFP